MRFWKPAQASRPAVKKVSQMIDSRSHKQKKYISLMLVPSYSAGKVRSLRVPQAVFYGVIAAVLAIGLTVAGMYLRSNYFAQAVSHISDELSETRDAFSEFQTASALAEGELLDAAAELYEQLNEENMLAWLEMQRQQRRQQYDLGDIWEHINTLEGLVYELDRQRCHALAFFRTRSIIPAVAEILPELEAAQAYLLELRPDTNDYAPGIRLLGTGVPAGFSQEYLIDRIFALSDELYLQRLMLESLESYRQQVNIYLHNFPTLMPIEGGIVTSGFGFRTDPIEGDIRQHLGVDIPAPMGTPIMAGGGGTVIFSGWRTGFGNTVFIDHGLGIVTLYAHNTLNLVYVGQRVERGQVIAYVGSTGRSLSPHLHYEVHVNGRPVNPVAFLLEGN